MGKNSEISWTKHTFNMWRGCSKVSPACAHCYAERDSKRNPKVLGIWGNDGTRSVAVDSYWRLPRQWNKEAEKVGERHRVFCASFADVFEDWTGPMTDNYEKPLWVNDLEPKRYCPEPDIITPKDREVIDKGGYRPLTMQDLRVRLFALIKETPNLDWLLLTKRPENVFRMTLHCWPMIWPRNVWLGTTVENQETANARIPGLLKIHVKTRFLSCEPLLGPIDLFDVEPNPLARLDVVPGPHGEGVEIPIEPGINWVIAGGESGPHSRPSHPDWFRSLRDQCQAAGIPFHFKQHGEWFPSDMFDYDTSLPVLDGGKEIYVGPNGQTLSTSSPFEHGCPCDHPPGFASMVRVGKKAAGRILDGRTWDEFPAVAR